MKANQCMLHSSRALRLVYLNGTQIPQANDVSAFTSIDNLTGKSIYLVSIKTWDLNYIKCTGY